MYPISIILPVFNGMKYLDLCVSSVINQSFANYQFLILDDCSTDDSWNYLESLEDDRIKIYRNDMNKGLFYNLNYLIAKSNSKLIKLWTQDDIMYPKCIETILKFHLDNPGIGFSYSGSDFIDGNGNALKIGKIDRTPPIISKDLHTKIAFITGSIAGNIANVTISSFALEKVGAFNENMKISGDFDMWVRIAEHFTIGYIYDPLIQLRNHSGQLSSQENLFIYHLKEDIQVYNYLFTYITKEERKNGIKSLRNQKLLFYFTLMLKAFLRGNLKVGFNFLKLISTFDKISIITWLYFKRKILFIKQASN